MLIRCLIGLVFTASVAGAEDKGTPVKMSGLKGVAPAEWK